MEAEGFPLLPVLPPSGHLFFQVSLLDGPIGKQEHAVSRKTTGQLTASEENLGSELLNRDKTIFQKLYNPAKTILVKVRN